MGRIVCYSAAKRIDLALRQIARIGGVGRGLRERQQLARPLARRVARLDPHLTARQLLEECKHVAPRQATANDHLASRIDPVHLKHRLRDQPDRRDLLLRGSPSAQPFSPS